MNRENFKHTRDSPNCFTPRNTPKLDNSPAGELCALNGTKKRKQLQWERSNAVDRLHRGNRYPLASSSVLNRLDDCEPAPVASTDSTHPQQGRERQFYEPLYPLLAFTLDRKNSQLPLAKMRRPALNDIHGKIREKCGYKKGVCFGITSLFVKSVLLKSERSFKAQLLNVLDQPEDFFTAIMAFQVPPHSGHNFQKILETQDPALFQSITNPRDINEIFTAQSLFGFLLEQPKSLNDNNIIFIVKSTTHAVALKPLSASAWELFDPSARSATGPEYFSDPEDLSERLYSCLRGGYHERGEQVALTFSALTASTKTKCYKSDLTRWENTLAKVKLQNPKAVNDLCNLAAESNDNKTLYESLSAYTTCSKQILEDMSQIVRACGFYPESGPSEKVIQAYQLEHTRQLPYEVADALNCSVVDVLISTSCLEDSSHKDRSVRPKQHQA